MRFCLLVLPLIGACGPGSPPGEPATPDNSNRPRLVGRLENSRIDEASGMARSGRRDDLYWIVTDDGDASLFAIDGRGRALGEVTVAGARHIDWEDLTSFTLDDTPYLMVADIGDNHPRRDYVRAYVVEEPEPGDSTADIAWMIEFSYALGSRDAESIAVDTGNERVLVLSKRDIPAVLFELPLKPGSDEPQRATPVGIPLLPQPGRRDIETAPLSKDWWWQPTAMDFSPDGSAAVILTYRGVYYYERKEGDRWEDAFHRQPRILSRGDFEMAESAAFTRDDKAVLITFEGVGAPLLRIDLGKEAET